MAQIIDADAHIVEPRSLWQEYVEPAFRDRVPQIAKDSEGIDRVKVEGHILGRSVLSIAAMSDTQPRPRRSARRGAAVEGGNEPARRQGGADFRRGARHWR